MNVSALAGNVCDRIDAGHLVHPNGQLAVVLDACVWWWILHHQSLSLGWMVQILPPRHISMVAFTCAAHVYWSPLSFLSFTSYFSLSSSLSHNLSFISNFRWNFDNEMNWWLPLCAVYAAGRHTAIGETGVCVSVCVLAFWSLTNVMCVGFGWPTRSCGVARHVHTHSLGHTPFYRNSLWFIIKRLRSVAIYYLILFFCWFWVKLKSKMPTNL